MEVQWPSQEIYHNLQQSTDLDTGAIWPLKFNLDSAEANQFIIWWASFNKTWDDTGQ